MAFELIPLLLTPISVQLVEAPIQAGIPKNIGLHLPTAPSQRAFFVGRVGLQCFSVLPPVTYCCLSPQEVLSRYRGLPFPFYP